MTTTRRFVLSGLFLSACLGLSEAAPAEQSYARKEAVAGKPLQLSYHGSANKDCTPAVPPDVKMVELPKNGVVTVREAKIRTNRIATCPNLQAPVRVVFYQARSDYAGPDKVVYEVTSSGGARQSYTFEVDVKPAPVAPKPESGTKL